MDSVLADVTKALLALGFPGIVIIALGFVSWRLWKENGEVQEKRLTDMRSSVEAINKNTNALENLTDILRDRKG